MTAPTVLPAPPQEKTTGAPTPATKALLAMFLIVPTLIALIGIPLCLVRGWVTWLDLVMLAVFYYIGIHGITIGYHRLFTHRAFHAAGWLRGALAVAGSIAVEGRVVDWVADHRKHHQFSDEPGDPHSPWEYGAGALGLVKGLWHAHIGWIFTYAGTDVHKYAPDLVADRVVARVSSLWPVIAAATFLIPAAIGYTVDGVEGAIRAFFWVGVVRVVLVHHLTWSVNSICHVWGSRPFTSRDQSRNVPVLWLISGGESWHNYHHADPTSARHGVEPGQVDTSAALIRLMEKAGWVTNVRWPSSERVAAKRVPAAVT